MTGNDNATTMRAIVQYRYGTPDDVLRRRMVDRPRVEADEVLVRVRAASVHPDVWHVVRGTPYVLRLMGSGLRAPKRMIPGTDMAGQVEAVGASVTRFQPGDEVFGETMRGFQWQNGGAYAEYVAVPEEVLALKPGNVTFEQAAAVPTSGLIALYNYPADARSQAGQQVLINGAGGGVGVIAVQLAKAYGARVTAVDNTEKLAMLRAIGADRVIDYTQEDFTEGSERYELIIDIPGNHSFAECRRVLAADGTYVLIAHDGYGATGRRTLGSLPSFFKLIAMAKFVPQLPDPGIARPAKQASMAELQLLLETGQLTPVIDRTFPLSQVREALRYLAQGSVQGKVVLTV